ncbi:hypothetical protein OCF62_11885 [Bacillus wiedmannii]|uniref:hypothetical protein n=1 Tax=Bacillus wiedmannii TaxID=1890302 RepID=UPI000BF31E8C|nr:hypothetical protein [Bacillus wiedmannii]MCU5515274.1 hypothetical protein [Bacillus wiedmannii]PEW70459.1 hypothetical protein CN424_25345 [Bacillus cereus]
MKSTNGKARELLSEFTVMKLEPITISTKRKGKVERYNVTLSDGTVRQFKRCTSDCGELLTYESFPKNSAEKDSHHNKCKKCMAEHRRKRRAEIVAKVNINDKKVCITCGKEKTISEYSTDGNKYRSECRPCQNEDKLLQKHTKTSQELGLHAKLDGEGISEFRKYVLNGTCILTGSEENVTIDHVIPTRLTGGSHIGNFLPIRRELNSSKGSLPFLLWIRTKRFREIADRFGITIENILEYKVCSAMINFMTLDMYERYTMWVWKMQQSEDTKHITANPTRREAYLYTTDTPYWFDHDGTRYYRPMVSAEERDELFKAFELEEEARESQKEVA